MINEKGDPEFAATPLRPRCERQTIHSRKSDSKDGGIAIESRRTGPPNARVDPKRPWVLEGGKESTSKYPNLLSYAATVDYTDNSTFASSVLTHSGGTRP